MSLYGANTDSNIWAFGTVELQAPEGTLWYGLIEAVSDCVLVMDADTPADADEEEEEMEPTQPYYGPSDDDASLPFVDSDATQPFHDDDGDNDDLIWPAPFMPPAEDDEMPKLEKPPVFVKLVSHVRKPDPNRKIVYRYVF